MQGLVVGRGQSLKTKRYNTYRVDRQVFRFTELDDLCQSNTSKSVCSDLTRTFFPQWLWVWPQKVMRPTRCLTVSGGLLLCGNSNGEVRRRAPSSLPWWRWSQRGVTGPTDRRCYFSYVTSSTGSLQILSSRQINQCCIWRQIGWLARPVDVIFWQQ